MFNDDHITRISDLLPIINSLQKTCSGMCCTRKERSEWIRSRLLRFKYKNLTKLEKGILRKYLRLMTSCDKRTITRHIKAYRKGKKLCSAYSRNRFPSVYTNADRELLAETDTLHGRLNGKATKNILLSEFLSGDKRYKRLSGVSCAHIYNLRKSRIYREQVQVQGKTQSVQVNIGERRKPEPDGRPGFLRVDTVHQGDVVRNGKMIKSLYHINLVDEITQYQVVFAIEAISEAFLKPVIEAALTLYPFTIINFHSDNGSEFINKTVAELLNKLLITQTKSRPRRSNDNGLAESKNGSTIRKHLGHWHIPKEFAPRLNQFYKNHFIPYLNFYRPCAFPEKKEAENGKIKITYPQKNYMTPLQKLLSLEKAEQYLKPGITSERLRKEAEEKSPNEAAREMQKAKKEFLKLALSSSSGILSSSP
jgi:transposase InsO family protein